jgi:hypothetical protein
MQNKFQPKRGDVNALTFEERQTLENKVIPKAERWVREYLAGTTLHEHGKQTLEYWDRLPASMGAAA